MKIKNVNKHDKKKVDYFMLLLLMVPISIFLDLLEVNRLFLFISSCFSIIPLAKMLGDATDEISDVIGPKAGGFLNATMGNIPELFIGIFSVRMGLFSLIKSSIVGSIAGNMLLVLGFSIILGGIKYKFQYFDKTSARINFGMLFLALIGFIIPFAYSLLNANNTKSAINLSLCIAAVLLIIYLLGLFFSFYTHRNIFIKSEDGESEKEPKWGFKRSVLHLVLFTAAIAYEAELLTKSVEAVSSLYNISQAFLGIIIVPVIGNIAEYTSAVIMALKNKINLSIEIAVGSGMQMALFVAPILMVISFVYGHSMNLIFSLFELITISCSIGLSLYIFQDGKTNWLEGVELLSAYIIFAVAYFFIE